ncbi:MAG TPA: HepT-like ribonuclease domain-containing protein [Anaerolineales bacterium]|nr:HepT-like ribonuclease domain-containing protein [Anaerolineales bacterium]
MSPRNWKYIRILRAMRNRIVHVYFNIDEKLMWDTIQNDLPPLIPELEKLL